MSELEPLFEEINTLIGITGGDLSRFERVLTDGYAHALTLESERWRIEKRIAELAEGIQRGDTAQKAKELTLLVKRLDATADDLQKLRASLADLRGAAERVRVA
jgi:hypothetical protein